MFTIPRAVVRAVRPLGRKAGGRPRGPAPPVVLRADGDAIRCVLPVGVVVVMCRVADLPAEFDPFELPFAVVVDAAVATGDSPVTVIVTDDRMTVSWADGDTARTKTLPRKSPDPEGHAPCEPETFAPVPAEFLTALHEASRTAGRGPDRFAYHRVQVRGAAGVVNASDGTTVYRHAGFTLPFAEDVLVSATAVFGSPVWRGDDLGVALTETYLVVRAGVWTAYLPVDAAGRFPDVDAVVPKAAKPATVVLDPADAAALPAALAALPGRRDDKQPVTLDFVPGRPAVLRGRDEASGEVAEHVLIRSPVANGSVRVAVNRAFLNRAVRLGCRTLRVYGPDKPVVAATDRVTWLAANLPPMSSCPRWFVPPRRRRIRPYPSYPKGSAR